MPTLTAAAPQTTKVLGYFNKNDFPINISSDHLGLRLQVAPKAYVKDGAGRLINDPRLDAYTQQGGLLVKEFARADVPLILLGSTPVAAAAPGTSVTAHAPKPPVQATLMPTPLPKPSAGRALLSTKLPELPPLREQAAIALPPQPPGGQPVAGAPSVRTMSVKRAVEAKLISPPDRRDRMAAAPNEDQTGEAAKSAPKIDQLMPVHNVITPPAVLAASRTLDTSGLAKLDAPDLVAAAVSEAAPASDITATPAAPAPAGATITIEPAVESAPATPVVTWNGKTFKTPGTLKKAMNKFFPTPEAAAEAFESFKGAFKK